MFLLGSCPVGQEIGYLGITLPVAEIRLGFEGLLNAAISYLLHRQKADELGQKEVVSFAI